MQSGFVFNNTIALTDKKIMDRNNEYLTFTTVVFILYCVMLVFSNIFIIIKLVNTLKERLYRIKGMMSMIPINIVMSDNMIKKYFINSGNIKNNDKKKGRRKN
jgi:hypothetical protein